jgi:hypothetical protein
VIQSVRVAAGSAVYCTAWRDARVRLRLRVCASLYGMEFIIGSI